MPLLEPKILYMVENSGAIFKCYCLYYFLVIFINMVKFTRKTYAQTGWRTYRRPDEKSGGHGVGWSPIIPYAFSVPQEWEEVIIYN
jgi:hypothetical protein